MLIAGPVGPHECMSRLFQLAVLSLGALVLLLACSSTKNLSATTLDAGAWELEFLSGPRIAFAALYPDKKPTIAFNSSTNRVQGNNSCNGYSADYRVEGDNLFLGEPGPTTMMYCGQGETFFMSMMEKVNRFEIDSEGKLHLMLDETTLLRFRPVRKLE